jgi:UDP-N-acetylmuramate dehydrogenase
MIDYNRLVQQLREQFPALDLREWEPMNRHTTFRVGGRVSLFVRPSTIEEIVGVCTLLKQAGERPFVMGRGSNLLVADEDLEGVVIQLAENFSSFRREGDTGLYAQAGATLVRLAQEAQNYGLTGLEFAGGIPGALGGGVSMNAGAYGGELKDVVVSVDYLDEDLNLRTATGAECDFRYRGSAFSDTNKVILGAKLELQQSTVEAVEARMEELKAKRVKSQPLEYPSAGSTFKRPVGGYAAAMIDEAGLKGYAIGGAQVSELHAGFVINTGNATAADILGLIELVQKKIYELNGVMLETEVRIVGRD